MPNYNFMPAPVDAGIGVAVVILFVMLGVYALLFGFTILSYVLQSLGMYTIAKRRGIRKPWLAWLPLGNMWILGSISDQYRYVAKGEVKNKRKALLGLTIALSILVIGIYVLYFAMIFQGVMDSTAVDGSFVLSYFAAIIPVALGLLVFSLIATVIQYIALYDLYASCAPSNAIIYLLLSIFINVTMPFFVFACRKKDLGMPPRKEDMPVQPVLEAEVIEPAEAVVTEETPEE